MWPWPLIYDLETQQALAIIIIYSFNVNLTSATFNNASTRYIIYPNACKRKRLIVCPKAENNFNETYFQKLSLQTEQMGGASCQDKFSCKISASYDYTASWELSCWQNLATMLKTIGLLSSLVATTKSNN